MKRITQKDWEVIEAALNMVAAGEWDDNSYGDRPDFETVIEKVQQRILVRS